MIQGLSASRGIAIGPAFKFWRKQIEISRRSVDDPESEWDRFSVAQSKVDQEITRFMEITLAETGPEAAAIFKAHRLILQDPEFTSLVKEYIFGENLNAEAAVDQAADYFRNLLLGLEDEYLRTREADIRDVANSLVRVLQGKDATPAANLAAPAIIVADDLSPSDTVNLNKKFVLGFCTALGSNTSHTAILARELGLPAIVGAGPGILDIPGGAELIIDGDSGNLFVNPDAQLKKRYIEKQKRDQRRLKSATNFTHEPALTEDQHRVHVFANISNLEGARLAFRNGAEGVGLFRTELMYLEHDSLPGEETQVQEYTAIIDLFGNKPVILRTLDIGGDKEIPYLDFLEKEANPFLGLRAVRIYLEHPEIFIHQIRAALRAGAAGRLKLMLPMVTGLDEVKSCRSIIENCQQDLIAEGYALANRVQLGIMIETPAAAIMAGELAEEVDFFSIGTNDLSQYVMAADRTNPAVASLACGYQPAVLRLVATVIEAGHNHGLPVGLCGNLASDQLAIPILVGLGIDELSVTPPAIPLIKELIRSLRYQEVCEMAQEALKCRSSGAVKSLVERSIPLAGNSGLDDHHSSEYLR